MSTTARPSATSPTDIGSLRRFVGAACLGVPALAVLAFGGQLLVTGWLDTRPDGSFHAQDLAWGSVEGILLFVALVASLRSVRRRPAALQQVLVVVAALWVAMGLTASPDSATVVLGLMIVLGVLLSPGRCLVFRRTGRASRPLLGLALVAAVLLVPYALDAAAAQRDGNSLNAELAGYVGATVWGLALPAVTAVAAVRSRGWQLPALCVAAAAAVMGVAGLRWPDIPSSLGTLGGLAALAWAGVVLTVVIAGGSAQADAGPERGPRVRRNRTDRAARTAGHRTS